ncbi:hypothetical protein A5695_14895 [Mycobacterium sp. E1747]|nr:hypothetical protein A5695_14895 [Mycobacterium sp. E1747]
MPGQQQCLVAAGRALLPRGAPIAIIPIDRVPRAAGDQHMTAGSPVLGQVGRQLTDVVETAKASSSTNKILLPLFITGECTSSQDPSSGLEVPRHRAWAIDVRASTRSRSRRRRLWRR